MSEKKYLCFMCENETMEHNNYQGTNIWICEDCPNVTFEYYSEIDISNLAEFLKERNKQTN